MWRWRWIIRSPPPIGTGQPGPTIQAPNQPTSISSGTLVNHAFAGGTGERGSHGANGGGGGGAGAVGSNAAEGPNPPNADPGGDGGAGLANVFRYGPSSPITYAGGGGGGGAGPGGVGGSGGTPTAGDGGTQASNPGTGASLAMQGTANSGSGGGGGCDVNPEYLNGGNAGSGVAVIRYELGTLISGTKATGGNVEAIPSGPYIIHSFTEPGPATFTNTSGSNLTVTYLMVGGRWWRS